jgi:hypothetical protein
MFRHGDNPKSAEEIQRDFFLPLREYFHRKGGLDADAGTVVLFQYQGEIIARATLDWHDQFLKPKIEDGVAYFGAFYFSSIGVFKPVSFDRMKKFWPDELRNFKSFRNAKLDLDPAAYPAFERRLDVKRASTSSGQGTLPPEQSAFVEVKRMVREQAFFVRNPKLAQKAKERDAYTCQICTFNFVHVYGQLGKDYAECHHLDPFSETSRGGKKSRVSTKLDRVITLCANCHRMVHRRRPAWPPERVEAALEQQRRGGKGAAAKRPRVDV